jgi:1,4-alpha-glucan branching enzyme
MEETEGGPVLVVRALLPWAESAAVLLPDERVEMQRIHPGGLFQAALPGHEWGTAYRLWAQAPGAWPAEFYDPYAFPPGLTDFDLYLIGEGTHYRTYEKLGAHLTENSGVRGVQFAVWAPNAQVVSVVGNFNGWDARTHPMRWHPAQGIWELFIPDLSEGEVYKYEVKSRYNNFVADKTDPYGFAAEQRPRTASVVANLDNYEWQDEEWMATRQGHNNVHAPIAIYEVHLGSWKRNPTPGTENGAFLNYRDLAHDLVEYVKRVGYTHIQLLPISEHPFDGSWGYQTIGYYAVTSRFGWPTDFMYFVDYCHQNGIGVFLDWVPAHFPKDIHGLNYFDGTHLYEHADPRRGEHPDWGTLVFNFGRNEVRNFLLSNALFWMDKYHLDGLRVDAVASLLYLNFGRKEGEWVPNQHGGSENLEAIEFLKAFNVLVHGEHPPVLTMAEDSSAWPLVTRPVYMGGLGFDLKWNMGWMNDILRYIKQDPIYRRWSHNNITFSLMYAFNENFILPFSHDEVVHLKKSMLAKAPGDGWQQAATLRALYGYQWTHPGKKLLFMGQDFGQWNEWNEARSLDWHLLNYPFHQQLLRFVTDLNHLYQAEPALWEVDDSWQGFEWMDANDSENSVISFVRRAKDPEDFVVVVCSFTPVVRYDYRVPVPRAGYYAEILNSDAAVYGGSNVGNLGGTEAYLTPWAEREWSITITLPPLSTLILKPRPLAPPPAEPAEPAEAAEAAPSPAPVAAAEPAEPSRPLDAAAPDV